MLQKVVSKALNQGFFALYKGATPPAAGWAAIDSVLLGSLHNYRLFLLRHGMTELPPQSGIPRLTLFAHGVAGLFAGWTRYPNQIISILRHPNRVLSHSAILATPVELLKGEFKSSLY